MLVQDKEAWYRRTLEALSGRFSGRNLRRELSLSLATLWVALTPTRSFPKHFTPLLGIDGASGVSQSSSKNITKSEDTPKLLEYLINPSGLSES